MYKSWTDWKTAKVFTFPFIFFLIISFFVFSLLFSGLIPITYWYAWPIVFVVSFAIFCFWEGNIALEEQQEQDLLASMARRKEREEEYQAKLGRTPQVI